MSRRTDPQATLCPVVVGRDLAIDRLTAALDAARRGDGALLALVGEAGVGKSRLTRHASAMAATLEMEVFTGRCVPSGTGVPHRALIEAFASRFRDQDRPGAASLRGFEGHLGRIVPHWGANPTGGAEESPLLLGEAVLRLAGLGGPSLLILEDLHWADAETASVIEYLADAIGDVPILCLITTRPEGRTAEDLVPLERRRSAQVITLEPLPADQIAAMVRACLGCEDLPPGLADWMAQRSDGLPLVVEELLAGLVEAGSLVEERGAWSVAGPLTASVPSDLAASVDRRLEGMTAEHRWVLAAAAMLGRRFDWQLLPGVAEVDGSTVLEAMRAAVGCQLIEVDGEEFSFRHSLTRDVVVARLLPPERRRLAERALPAVELAHPGLPGSACELAADLAEAAGRPDRASEHLVESARRALANGAFHTAEATSRRASALAHGSERTSVEADATLCRVLVGSGKPIDALEVGTTVLERCELEEQGALRLVLARAALTAGQLDLADELVVSARSLGGAPPSPGSARAELDAIAAHIALARGRSDVATEFAERALSGALDDRLPAVACEALEVLGRLAARPTDAIAHLDREAEIAGANALAEWHLRARHELALVRWGEGDVSGLREVRALASSTGALVTQAVMDLSLADVALADLDTSGCLDAAEACVRASRRFGLATEPVAHLWLAGAHALASDRAAMERSVEAALAADPEDPRILGDLEGRVRATLALVEDDLAAMARHLDAMMIHVEVAPATTSVFPGRSLWATLHAIDDADLGVEALAVCRRWVARYPMWPIELQVLLVQAVVLGRQGHGDAAAAMVERARDGLRRSPPGIGIARAQQMLVAAAAARDGWGDPVPWLRECEAFFTERELERVARRCRLLLRESGAPVPRSTRSRLTVPASLRALGLTAREFEVLQLIAAGSTNREVADRLVISPRTVERHLENLFSRVGVRDRHTLVAIARDHGLEVG